MTSASLGATEAPNHGARIISGTGILGAAVALYNYLSPASGIDDTGGALLVIVTSIILFGLGFTIGAPGRTGGLRKFLSAACLILILGTAFAAFLLESWILLILMSVCAIGWLMHAFGPRRKG